MAALTQYMNWLNEQKGLAFTSYHDLYQWSVTELATFWGTMWDYFNIQSTKPYQEVLAKEEMPGAVWFPNTELNYTEHVFRNSGPRDAIIYASELRRQETITWDELEKQVAAFAAALKENGIHKGDRVAAYISNIHEAVIAFLACASLGVIWSSCSPEFGSQSVIDRFKQIEPKLLIAVDGYRYGGKDFNRMDTVHAIQAAIPSIKKTVLIPYLVQGEELVINKTETDWDAFLSPHLGKPLNYERVPFDHPLWILFSSGTTGIPKAIVQGHGGILLEHLKALSLHTNLDKKDRFFWYTTTGWMMWNFLVGGLLTGSSIILYDGNPVYPDPNRLWRLAEETEMTVFGTSAGFLTQCMKSGITPGQSFDLSQLKAIGSTGSPLPPSGFEWVYQEVKEDLLLASASGGTDVCSAFILGCPILPVYSGELQCRGLGCSIEAFDEKGEKTSEIGELVLTKPIPSMPIYFWNDPDGERYKDSYFDKYPGIWRHGDYLQVTERGGCIIYGRSDATINRGGVRMGTSEIYSAVEKLPEVRDSLIVDIHLEDDRSVMPLFVVLEEGEGLEEDLMRRIRQVIRENCSPRHVPTDIIEVSDIPRTINGKKLEVPVKKILTGVPIDKAANPGSLSNPETLNLFVELGLELGTIK
ncbi:acetoacetate--CoA ligase [Pullulanibacillus sp. KACC 23026]|uniref:acetoacetate--CoA ligase n=1 Tax=Pullulanibacillus sp. KACC 23026 TaxID=3028315 RepID=UPI0023B0578B|nr:acetoacetate--CoA ligase [Pullulanibacillus sp. KACC 23026]WEG14949.1 acetoacetate--CoA ligase [Pullulanibacillus sp. KACC 23026]